MSVRLRGQVVLRYGLAVVFLYFGFSQLFDSLRWVALVPSWAVELIHLPPAMIVLANGVFDLIGGTLLVFGLWVRPVAYVLSLHVLLIAASLGVTPVGVRDFGLAMATLALGLLEKSHPHHD